MAKIDIYTSPWCGFCHRAKLLLAEKGVQFTEIDVTMTPGAREEMVSRGGGRTVPQIFADDMYVGDCNGILALDAAGQLDAKLRKAACELGKARLVGKGQECPAHG